MPWFQKLCRNAGLTLHHVMQPARDADRQTVRKTVEEQKISDTVTVRRTTIEEVEIKRPLDSTPD